MARAPVEVVDRHRNVDVPSVWRPDAPAQAARRHPTTKVELACRILPDAPVPNSAGGRWLAVGEPSLGVGQIGRSDWPVHRLPLSRPLLTISSFVNPSSRSSWHRLS